MRIKSSKTANRCVTSKRGIRRFFLYMVIAIISTHTLLLLLVLTKNVNMSSTRNYAYNSDQTNRAAKSATNSTSQQISANSVRNDPLKGLIRLKGRSASMLLSSGNSGLLSGIITQSRNNFYVCKKPEYRIEVGPMTALASFPGSGNTWIRYLLQEASGLLTGSVYKDYSLLRNGFAAESVTNGSVIVVKTHEWGAFTRRQFDRAVLLVRNPFKTLLAEFNRRAAGHLGHASSDRFLKGKGWKEFAVTQVTAWTRFTLDWLNFSGPLLILRYEEVVNDLENQLNNLLEFLNVTVRPNVIECVLNNRNGVFKRPSHLLPFDPFSVNVDNISLRKFVEKQRVVVYEAIRRHETSELRTVNGNNDKSTQRSSSPSTRHLKNVINVISSFVDNNSEGDNATDKDISLPTAPL